MNATSKGVIFAAAGLALALPVMSARAQTSPAGSGGSAHGAWPDERVGFSYVPTELRSAETDDRARRLLADLYADLR